MGVRQRLPGMPQHDHRVTRGSRRSLRTLRKHRLRPRKPRLRRRHPPLNSPRHHRRGHRPRLRSRPNGLPSRPHPSPGRGLESRVRPPRPSRVQRRQTPRRLRTDHPTHRRPQPSPNPRRRHRSHHQRQPTRPHHRLHRPMPHATQPRRGRSHGQPRPKDHQRLVALPIPLPTRGAHPELPRPHRLDGRRPLRRPRHRQPPIPRQPGGTTPTGGQRPEPTTPGHEGQRLLRRTCGKSPRTNSTRSTPPSPA